MRTWSPQQEAFFHEFQHGTGNIVGIARAGVGKTTTGVHGVTLAPERNILFCAFNKKIAQELESRFGSQYPHVTVKTIHAVGYAIVRKCWEGVRCDFSSARADALAEQVCGAKTPDAIKRLVSKLHTKGREIAPHATVIGDLTDLAMTFELYPDDSWESLGFDMDYVEAKALEAMELAASVRVSTIDGSDMLYLPIRNQWLAKTYDIVVVDEAQDMTVSQLEIAEGVCKGRIVIIGDDRQAIYAFRGADCDSLNRLKEKLDGKVLRLTTTYRCAKAIVREAQRLVPDFEAGDDNPEGEVLYAPLDKLLTMVQPGDFVLSRVNAPLVSLAISMLRAGKRARVAGRDLGAGLTALVRKLKAASIPDLMAKIARWEQREVERMMKAKRPERVDAIHDQAEMLVELARDARGMSDLDARISALFSDDGLGDAGVVTFSSVHRSKGLEANRVFVLESTLRDNNQEELNIQYVAITRAKQTLVWVTGEV